jgi:LasA protease
MRSPARTYRFLCLFLLLGLFSALACGQVTSDADYLSPQDLRQTMAALPPGTQVLPQQPAAPGVTELPLPVETLLPGVTAQPAEATPLPAFSTPSGPFITYRTRSGDTLLALALRFSVQPNDIISPQPLPAQAYLPLDVEVYIPVTTAEPVTPGTPLLPDSEIVYSPASANFDLALYVQQAGGYLSTYTEMVESETLTGAAILQRIADELSVNPRLLLAFLEYRSGWVSGQPRNPNDTSQPIGWNIPDRLGLYQEVMIVATQLNVAYYGWRQGSFTTLTHGDGTKVRLNPSLNAGSVAIQHLLAMFYRPVYWQDAVYGTSSFLSVYNSMFGDPWARAVEPLLPAELSQPTLELPYLAGEPWALTSGPHNSWNAGTPRGALDFSPITGQPKCTVSVAWVTAAAPGWVVRSSYNAVVLDVDGDALEATGWVLLYYHIADEGRITAPVQVSLDAPLGHPSCEGGRATGTHLHLARKYNGEWMPADGPVPFVLSGWRATADELNYTGTLVNGSQVVRASPGGMQGSTIIRAAP